MAIEPPKYKVRWYKKPLKCQNAFHKGKSSRRQMGINRNLPRKKQVEKCCKAEVLTASEYIRERLGS